MTNIFEIYKQGNISLNEFKQSSFNDKNDKKYYHDIEKIKEYLEKIIKILKF